MPKRELVDTDTDKRFVRRSERGRFKEAMTKAARLLLIAARRPSAP
jgi:hypothetical protein